MKKQFLEAGRVNNTHALTGEVKFEHWCDSAETAASLKNLYLDENGKTKLEIASVRRQGNVLLLSFRGYDDIDKVLFLKGKVLFAARSELDPAEKKVFVAELLGLDLIEAESGRVYGKICGVSDRGAGLLYEIRTPDGRECYFPAVKEWILSMDVIKGVFVHAPEGLFD